MAGLDPAIHVFPGRACESKTWMPGSRPGMTIAEIGVPDSHET
jgi:hypothetical protein